MPELTNGKYNWELLWSNARIHAPTCRSIAELADRLKIPASTLKDAMTRDVVTREGLHLGKDLAGRERVLVGEEGANVKTLVFQGQRILTPEQLLAYCEIDLSVWREEQRVVNKWEVGANVERKDLSWHEGVLTGTITSTGTLTIEPLFQIKIRLVRIKPIPLFPTIQPVAFSPGTFRAPKKQKRTGKWRRALVWSDPHFWYEDTPDGLRPLHNRRVLDIICRVASSLKVDSIHCLGDVFDMTDMTDKFWRDPAVTGHWQLAIEEGAWWLAQMASIAPLSVHEGNHDFRLPKALATHFPAAYQIKAANQLELPPVLSVPGLLAFADMNITWVDGYPRDEEWLSGALLLKHGDVVRQGPGATATAVAKEAEQSTLFGHIHRVEMAVDTKRRSRHKREVTACSVGCACHTDGRLPGAAYPNWQNGFAVVDYLVDGHEHYISPYVIRDDRVMVSGELITGRDRMDDIRKACPRWFN